MATKPYAPRFFLVIPSTSANPRSGTGQRSVVFFSALKQLGPTEIIVLGKTSSTFIEEYFPGNAGVHLIDCQRFAGNKSGPLARAISRIADLIMPEKYCQPDTSVQAKINELLAKETDRINILVYRYFLTFCICGIAPGHPEAPKQLVDIDDRDDHKYLAAYKNLFGGGLLLRVFKFLVLRRLLNVMRAKLKSVSHVWFAAGEDREDFTGISSSVVRNVPFVLIGPQAYSLPSEQKNVLFVGIFAHRPNINGVRWFLKECWPQINKKYPEFCFRIVGMGNWASLRSEFPGARQVEFVGFIEDIAAEYEKARVVVSPILEGGGSKIKVIEACAFARPVVSTSHSARGFGQEIAKVISKADNPEEFVALCCGFLDDGLHADSTGEALRVLQRAQYSREATEASIRDDVENVLHIKF